MHLYKTYNSRKLIKKVNMSNYWLFLTLGSPLPRPVLPQQRSMVDRLVDYIVGDGPSNRYALICRQCDSHNGMALKEEFEYFGKFKQKLSFQKNCLQKIKKKIDLTKVK